MLSSFHVSQQGSCLVWISGQDCLHSLLMVSSKESLLRALSFFNKPLPQGFSHYFAFPISCLRIFETVEPSAFPFSSFIASPINAANALSPFSLIKAEFFCTICVMVLRSSVSEKIVVPNFSIKLAAGKGKVFLP